MSCTRRPIKSIIPSRQFPACCFITRFVGTYKLRHITGANKCNNFIKNSKQCIPIFYNPTCIYRFQKHSSFRTIYQEIYQRPLFSICPSVYHNRTSCSTPTFSEVTQEVVHFGHIFLSRIFPSNHDTRVLYIRDLLLKWHLSWVDKMIKF